MIWLRVRAELAEEDDDAAQNTSEENSGSESDV
jgi:hypothetical protein